MRLQNFINENLQNVADDLIHIINHKAKPFMKEFGNMYSKNNPENYIYRSISPNPSTFVIKTARQNRKPRLISQDLHKYLSKISKKIFGWDMRTQGVFTADSHTAWSFGVPSIFIALGEYKYVYSTSYHEAYLRYDKEAIIGKERYEQNKKDLYDIYKEKYKNKGLSNILKKGENFEAVFKCKEYLIIDPHFYQYIQGVKVTL